MRPDRGLVPFDCCKTGTATQDCCTCSFYHGAYSHNCTCWKLPVSIVLVNRQVYNVAMSIFYKQNRFIVFPGGALLDRLRFCDERLLSLVDFFRKLLCNALPLLRSIGLVILLLTSELVVVSSPILTK
ncbi:hypothetical protein F4677DRAFT_34918 [Hypoxylon crocopeplum]|nr:hypothetical protein F4677DRAFT_34918 [Hypoxylon crocopeplum]